MIFHLEYRHSCDFRLPDACNLCLRFGNYCAQATCRAGQRHAGLCQLCGTGHRRLRQYHAVCALTISRVSGGGNSPVSVGVGGSTGGYRSGVGLGVGFSFGGGPRKVQDLQLSVRIDDAATGNALWEGRAIAAVPAKAPAAQPSLAAAKLAEALFKDFPGESGRTITVP